MNKEEIEKEDKEHLIEVLTEHKDYIFEFDDDNIKIEYILDYIRELEFQNTALKAEHNHNITRIKNLERSNKILDTECSRLEQKESILDKVTDKLKETVKIERQLMPYLPHKSVSFYYANGREVLAKEILNIIEGGNNGK